MAAGCSDSPPRSCRHRTGGQAWAPSQAPLRWSRLGVVGRCNTSRKLGSRAATSPLTPRGRITRATSLLSRRGGVELGKAGLGAPVPCSVWGTSLRDPAEGGLRLSRVMGRGGRSWPGGPKKDLKLAFSSPTKLLLPERPSLGDSTAVFLASRPKQGALGISFPFAGPGLCTQHCTEILYTSYLI